MMMTDAAIETLVGRRSRIQKRDKNLFARIPALQRQG